MTENSTRQHNGGPDSEPIEAQHAFLELSQILLGNTPLGEVLERVAALAVRAIPDVDQVSVTLVEGGKVRSVAFTGDLAVHLDERQYQDGFGPCLDAATTGRTIEIPDMTAEDTYSDFARQAHRAGVTNTLSVGLPIPQRIIGALNLYGRSGRAFGDDEIALARSFASYAAVALANATLYTSTAELARNMEAAMASRAVIEQAKGVLMAKHACSADEAFSSLVRASQHANRKLRQIAQDIVDHPNADL